MYICTKRSKAKRPTDKTSQGTKRHKGQNVPRDNTSQGQNVTGTKRAKGQKVPRDKTSQWTNEAHYLRNMCGQLPHPISPR